MNIYYELRDKTESIFKLRWIPERVFVKPAKNVDWQLRLVDFSTLEIGIHSIKLGISHVDGFYKRLQQ